MYGQGRRDYVRIQYFHGRISRPAHPLTARALAAVCIRSAARTLPPCEGRAPVVLVAALPARTQRSATREGTACQIIGIESGVSFADVVRRDLAVAGRQQAAGAEALSWATRGLVGLGGVTCVNREIGISKTRVAGELKTVSRKQGVFHDDME